MSALLPLYRALTTLGSPAISWYLGRRRARGKEDGDRFNERFGIAKRPRPTGTLIWVHGASVGESLTMLPVIERLLAERQTLNVMITTSTVTSAKLLAKRLPVGAFHQYIPVDLSENVRRFLNHWRPDLALWSESEFWPNLVTMPAKRGIPMILVNGRVSPGSYKSWRRWRGLICHMLKCFTCSLAQSDEDAQRLTALGARNVTCTGNLKYSTPPLPIDPDDLNRLEIRLAGRPNWLAASTHPGEEEICWQVHQKLRETHPELLSIIVPRHPERGAEIKAILEADGARVALRSTAQPVVCETDIYIADTLGELGLFYRHSGIVFMGKSLVDLGGQNPLEPARLDCAILFGPHMWNFSDITQRLVDAEAAETVADPAALGTAIANLLDDQQFRQQRADNALRNVEAQSGILDTVISELNPYLDGLTDKEGAT